LPLLILRSRFGGDKYQWAGPIVKNFFSHWWQWKNKLECLSLASIFYPSLTVINILCITYKLALIQAHKYDTSLNNLLGTNILAYLDTLSWTKKKILWHWLKVHWCSWLRVHQQWGIHSIKHFHHHLCTPKIS
jgi:hypothetical protein